MLTLLFHPVFGRLYAAQIVALLGTGLLTVGLGLLAYDLAGDQAGAVLGLAYAIKMAAYVGLSPVAAALLVHVPRRPVLIGADLIRAAVALSLPFITEIWQIYLAIALLQSASATFTPAFQATIPDILAKEADYTRALSLSRLAYDLENLISPALAGALLMVMGYHWLFMGTVTGFVASALLIRTTPLPQPGQDRARPFRERLTRGLRIYLATPRLRGLLSLNLGAAAAGAFVIVNTVVVVRSGYGGEDGDVALALGAFGAGSMLAALALPGLLDRTGDRPVMMAGGLFLTILLAGQTSWLGVAGLPPWSVLLWTWGATGLAYAAILTPSGRLLRRSARSADRPALFTAQFALSHACWLITYPLAGWTMARLGTAPALAALGILAGLGLVFATRLWPAQDPEALAHGHPDLPADHPHLQAHGGRQHSHAFVIDDAHHHWPTHG
ncbi:MAG: MFS transporter [Flavimaricola sp.]|nr:MFS transporter [Flavimaricola sp.]